MAPRDPEDRKDHKDLVDLLALKESLVYKARLALKEPLVYKAQLALKEQMAHKARPAHEELRGLMAHKVLKVLLVHRDLKGRETSVSASTSLSPRPPRRDGSLILSSPLWSPAYVSTLHKQHECSPSNKLN